MKDVIGASLGLVRRSGTIQISALIVAALLPLSVRAQDLPKTISPIQVEPDRNGVNIVRGKITPDALVLSVPAAPRLRFDRVQNAAPYVTGEQHRNWDTSDEMSAEWTVHTADGVSEAFRCVWDTTDGKQCASVAASGSSLNYGGNFYRKSGTGERYVLDKVHLYANPPRTNPNPRFLRLFYASRVEYPDGEVISYTYDTATLPNDPNSRIFYRPNKIATNLGYYITISYPHNDLTQIGWGAPNAAALYSVNDPATPLARLTDNGNGSVTDLAGRTFQGYGLGTLGLDLETANFSRTLPTEATPALSVAPAAGLPSNEEMVGSVNRDGVVWGYAYTNPAYYAAIDGYLFDKVDATGPNGYHKIYSVIHTNPLGPWGTRNLVKNVTDELGRQTSYDYDSFLRLTKVTRPEGNSVSLAWDLAGNIVSKTSAPKPGSGLPNLIEQSHVDLGAYLSPSGGYVDCANTVMCWRPSWHRDALNRQTDFAYNARGQLLEALEPADVNGVRRKTLAEYEEKDTGAGLLSRKTAVRTCGDLTTCGTQAEIRMEYEYWQNTNLPTVERQRDLASGQVRENRYTYDLAGHVLSIDGPLPGWDDTQYFRYDILGRKTWEIEARAPNGLRIAKRYAYRDSDDKVVGIDTGTLPSETSTALSVLEHVDTLYDGRRYSIREVTSAAGQVLAATDRSFSDQGLPECSAIRMNPATLPAASATAACGLGASGSAGPDRITRNIYDAAGQLEKVQQAYGTPLVRNQVTYTYTANGLKEFVTDANGNKAQFVYDGYDRHSQWRFPDKMQTGQVASTDYEQYGYDAVGNRTSLRRRDGRTLAFTYDSSNRAISKIIPDGCAPLQVGQCAPASATRDVYFAYDIMGRELSAKFDSVDGSDGVTRTYSIFGDLITSTISMGGFTKTLRSAYDAAGNRTSITHPDGQVFTYAYDALNRLSALYDGDGTAAPLMQFTYNQMGNVAGRTERPGSGVSYSYDALGRLAGQSNTFVGGYGNLTTGPITYNPASQILSVSRNNDLYVWRDAFVVGRGYTVNGLNQYISAGSAGFTYDTAGNLLSDGSSTYLYDGENRLISGSGDTSLAYDPLGRLWSVSNGSAVTRFLYDGDALIGEFDASGALTARYVHGDDLKNDDPLVSYDAGGMHLLHSDHQGSIVAETDSSGASPSINTYDEYGIPGRVNRGRFQYTGQSWISELGMYYYKARFYSPTLGRFLQVDPIGYEDQFNLYAYVGNDPVNGLDPTGTCTGSRLGDADGGCSGGGFVAGAGQCLGACTSNRGRANAVLDGAIEQAKSGTASSGANQCATQPQCGGNTPEALQRDILPLLKSKEFRARVVEAWTRSKPYGLKSEKNEHAFWSNSVGGRVSVGRVFVGVGSRVSYRTANYHRMGENVFTHVHPFSLKEGYLYGFSTGDIAYIRGLGIIGVAFGFDGIYYYDGRGN